MNPRDRLLTTLRGGATDRVPLILEGFHRTSVEDEAEPAAREIAERIFAETHFFVGCNTFVNRYLVTPPQRMRETGRDERNGSVTSTTEIDTPKGKLTAVTGHNATSRTTWTIKYPVESLADIEKIRSIPWERPPRLAPPDLSNLPPGFEQRGIVHAGVSSPFVCVAGMMPFEYFLELCATELELLRDLTQQCLERILDVLDVVMAERTVEYVWMGGSEWLTPPMGAPRHYEVLVQDFEKTVIERIHAGGAVSHVHCHGNVRSTLEQVIQRGGDLLEPMEPPPDGDIMLAEAKAVAAGRIALGGNVESRILEHGSVSEVEQATRAAFEGGKHRMVLENTAGPISTMTPKMAANYRCMIDVWEELSPM